MEERSSIVGSTRRESKVGREDDSLLEVPVERGIPVPSIDEAGPDSLSKSKSESGS